MPLNKHAGFGHPSATPRVPARIADVLSTRWARLNHLVGVAVKPIDPLHGRVPTETALRVVWSLNVVRDALCDQTKASAAETNLQIEARWNSQAVDEIFDMLQARYPDLADEYEAQFCLLDTKANYSRLRRERLAELAAFEWHAMAEIQDPPQPAAAKRAAAAKRRRP